MPLLRFQAVDNCATSSKQGVGVRERCKRSPLALQSLPNFIQKLLSSFSNS
jgi:hypothetical protein